MMITNNANGTSYRPFNNENNLDETQSNDDNIDDVIVDGASGTGDSNHQTQRQPRVYITNSTGGRYRNKNASGRSSASYEYRSSYGNDRRGNSGRVALRQSGGSRGASRRDRDYGESGNYAGRKYQLDRDNEAGLYSYTNTSNSSTSKHSDYHSSSSTTKPPSDQLKLNLPEDTRISKLMRRLSMERDGDISLAISRKLLEVLLIPENAAYIRKSYCILHESMLDILKVSPGTAAKEQCARALGRMGYVMGKECAFDKFLHYVMPKVQTDMGWLVMIAIKETLVLERAKPVLRGVASRLMKDIVDILESTDNVDLFKPSLDNLISVVELYPDDFFTFFRDTTDLLLGWHVDVTQPMSIVEFVSISLQRLHKHFKMNLQLSVTLILHFIDDIEGYSVDMQNKEGEQTVEHLTLSIMALNTILKCLGENFAPGKTENVTLKVVTDCILQIITTVSIAVEGYVPTNLVIAGNESISLLLPCLTTKTAGINTALLKLIYLQLSIVDEYTNSAAISILLMIAKIIKELSANLPLEIIPKLVGPESELIKLRSAPFHSIQESIICIYQALLNLKNIPLLQEAYRYILGDLEQVYRLVVPAVGNLVGDNPFDSAKCDLQDAEMTTLFLLRCMCQLANASGSIIGMWALKPSILELLGVHLLPSNEHLAVNYPTMHYSLLYLIYSHCKCYNYFISSSTLVSAESQQKMQMSNLDDVSRKSPNSANFAIILNILHKTFRIQTSTESRLLLLQWFKDIISNVEPYLEVLHTTKEFYQVAELQINCGYLKNNAVNLAVAANLENLLNNKLLSWNNQFLRDIIDLCVLHITSSKLEIRSRYTELSSFVPWDVAIAQFATIGERETKPRNSNMLGQYNRTNIIFAQQLHLNGSLFGEMYPLQFKAFMQYLLKDGFMVEHTLEDFFLCCWPIEAEDSQEHIVNDRYKQLALLSSPIINNWCTWEAAQFCVNTKLRTPLGKPNETFTSFERVLKQLARDVMRIKQDESDEPHGIVDKTRVRLLLQFMEHLEMSIYNAREGCAVALVQVNKPVRTFFSTNSQTCKDWLSRIRIIVIQLALHAGLSSIALRQGQELLNDLALANKTNTVDFEKAAMYTALSLLNLRETEALHGLHAWCRNISSKNFGWLKYTADQAGKRFEAAAIGYRNTMAEASVEMKLGQRELLPDIHTRYFISDQIINCHKELNNWIDVINWKNDDLYSDMVETENGMRYSLNSVNFECAQHLFNLEIQKFAFNELTTWKEIEKTKSWSSYDILSNTETQLYHIALNISLQKDEETEKKIDGILKVINQEIQHSLAQVPSEFLQPFNFLSYVANGLKEMLHDVPASTIFLVSENFEKDVGKIDSSLLTKILWWSEYFCQVQQQPSSIFCSNLRLNIINKARKERNFNLASSHLYRFLKNKDLLQTMVNGQNTLLAKIGDSFMSKIPEIPHWNFDTAKSVQELVKLLYEHNDNRQLTFNLCATASTAITKCADLYGGVELKEISSRILLKLAGWLQINEQVSITEINSPLAKLLMVLPEIASIDNCVNTTIPHHDMVIGKLLKFSVQQCVVLAKSWNIFGTWCYRWGRKIVDSSTDMSTVLSEEDKACIMTSLPANATQEDIKRVYTILAQTRSGTDEEDIDSNEINTSEKILSQLKAVAILGACQDEQLEGLVNIWRNVQKRVYAYYELSAEAYFKYLELATNSANMSITTESNSVTVTLRLLRLIVKHALELQTVLESGLATTPTHPWKVIIPQLFSRLTHPESYVRQRVSELLCRIAKDAPHLITFPAVVGALEGGVKFDFSEISMPKDSLSQNEVPHEDIEIEEDFDSDIDENKNLLQDCFKSMVDTLSTQAPETITQVQLLVKELRRIILLWDELWLGTLAQHQSDISRRQVQLTGEVKKVNDNTHLNEEEKVSLISEKHRIIFKPIIFILEQLNEITSAEPETPHEKYFQERYSKQIDELLTKLKNPDNPGRPDDSWQLLRHLQSQFQHRAHKRSLLNMQNISPILAAVKDTVISMPGQFSSTTVTIAKVSSKVAILPTKTKPKKLIFYGSDGHKYTYLFKGLEDLHLDERIMQFLSIANTMMAHSSSKETGVHQYQDLYSARHYSVIPLGPRSGLISWVDGTTPVFAMYKRWQQREAIKQQISSKNQHLTQQTSAILRPSELFYNKLNPLLTKHGVKNLDNRKEWPLSVLKQVLNELVAETPGDLLTKELWCHSVDTSSWWRKIRKYSYSVAVMSIIGYIIGLGDRHLDNVLVDLNTGEVVHIDYNVCFEKGKTLCVPEKVPFRLTQNIRDALGVTGVEGIFRIACEQVLKTMKKGRETLLTLLEAFVYDPLVDWTVGNEGLVGTSFGEGRALNKQHRKDIEKEVTLAMYNVRCTEMKSMLKENGTDLFHVLPIILSQLQTVIDSHADSRRLDDTLQDLHQQMAFVKEAEANPQTKHSLDSLPSRFAKQLKTQDLYNLVQCNLENLMKRCEDSRNAYAHAIQKVVDDEFSEQLKEITTLGDFEKNTLLASGVENFLRNAGQLVLVTQCEEIESEINQLLVDQTNLVKNCFGQLQEYNVMLAPCPRSYIDRHRVHLIAKLSSFLHSTQDLDYFDQIFKEFRLFRDDPTTTHHSKHIIKYAVNLFVVYNEVSARISALFEELQSVNNANRTSQIEKSYNDAKVELGRFLQRETGASEALEFVLVAVLIVLNKNFLTLETAAAKTGDWLLRLTSRDGDWFLDDLIMSCNKAMELVSYVAMPANGVTDLRFGQLLNGLQVANTMYRSLYELNLNFHTIILSETIREMQSENESVLQMIHDFNRLINSMDCPIVDLIVHLEKHYNCLVMEMENASYSYIQARLLDLKAQYNTMIHNNQPLTSGQMLLMGFNGLFEKLDIESANLCNALSSIDVPNSWRKVDQIKEAKSISPTIWIYNSEINHILDDIFFLKRLQTMDEFFSMCLQIGQWAKTVDFNENMFRDERLIKPVRKYIADYISRRFLGVTTETIGYIICHLLQKLGLDLENEIEQKDIGAEHKVPLDELYHKGWQLFTKRNTFTQNTFSHATTLENNLRTAWEKLQEPKKLEQTLRILRSSCLRVRTQLNTHNWMYEEVIVQHPFFQKSTVFLRSRFFKSFENDVSQLESIQQSILEAKERQSGLIACVEQRLKWAAGSSPDEIKPLLAAFTQRCQSQPNITPIQTLITISNTIILHERLRGHQTQESRSLDQQFISHFDQWRQACQNKRELFALLSGDDGTGEISDIERTLMGYYTPEMVGNQMWMQMLAERISLEIATILVQIESQLETTVINEMEFRRVLDEIKSIHRQLCIIVAEFKILLKSMIKIEEFAHKTQTFLSAYQQLSDHFQPLLRPVHLEQCALEILDHLRYISEESPAIYSSLLSLATADETLEVVVAVDSKQLTAQLDGSKMSSPSLLLVRQGAMEDVREGGSVVKQESREQQRNAYAVGVWRRVRLKLEGRDPDPGRRLTIQEQVDYVIREASSVDNLASLYEGWTPWV